MIENDSSGSASQAFAVSRRVARPTVPVHDAVVLADVSDSMGERDVGGSRGGEFLPPRRIDRLAKVLNYLLARVRVRSLICFADLPINVPLLGRVVLPEPAGSTGLDVALRHVGELSPRPAKVIVISDGMPNSVQLALDCARLLRPMIIDAYYVGPEAWEPATRFMSELASCGGPGGRSGHFNMLDPALLGTELTRGLLAAPR